MIAFYIILKEFISLLKKELTEKYHLLLDRLAFIFLIVAICFSTIFLAYSESEKMKFENILKENSTEAKIKENEIILNQKSDYNAKLWRKIKNKYHFYLAGLSNFKFYNFYTNQSCDNINVFNLNTQENANIKGIVLNEIPQNLNLGVRWIIKDLEAKKYYVFTQISTQYEHEGIKADKTEFSFEEVASLLEIKDAEFVELLSKNNISL
jgi:hypothetical protein